MVTARTSPALVSDIDLENNGRTAWGAILAGTVVGLAVFAMLSLLGIGIGLSAIEIDTNDPMGVVPSASPIWMFLSQLIALGVGGYVAGHLAGTFNKTSTALHGAAVWGLATLAAAWLAVSIGSGLFNLAGSALNTAGNLASSAASGVASAGRAIMPDDINLPEVAVDQVTLDDLPDPLRSRLRQNGITPENFQREARQAFRSVISRSEQARAEDAIMSTVTNIAQEPANIGEELSRLADRLVGGENAILNEQDKREALAVLERRTGMTPAEVENYIEQVEAELAELRGEAEARINQAQVALQDAEAQAVETANEALDTTANAALMSALASLLGLLAAVGGAIAGRPSYRY